MPTHRLKTRALMLCLTLFLAGAALSFGAGQAEPRIADAERLIQQQDYVGALRMLAAIQRNNPELRDETTRLMTVIMGITQRYNAVLADLNQAVVDGDEAKMQELIAQLQRIDPVRAATIKGEAEVLIGFLKLMRNAQALLDAGRTADALVMYTLALTDPRKAGVTLPKDQFEAGGYGELVTTSVRKSVAGIVTAATEQAKTAAALPGTSVAVRDLLARPAGADSPAAFDAAVAPLRRAASAEGIVRGTATSLAAINRNIQLNAEKGRDDLYLRYLVWLCLGRQSRPEGIAHALRLLWAGPAQSSSEMASASATAAFDTARERYETGSMAEADAGFQDVAFRSVVAVKAAGLLGGGLDLSAQGWQPRAADVPSFKSTIGRAFTAQEQADEADGYRLLIGLRKDIDALPVTSNTPAIGPGSAAEAAKLASARTLVDSRAREARVQAARWRARQAAWEQRERAGVAEAALGRSAQGMADMFARLADRDLEERDLAYALRVAAIGGAGFPARLADAVALRMSGEDQMSGTVKGQAPAGAGLANKYPDKAVPAFTTARSNLDSLTSDIEAQEQKLEAEKPFVKSSPVYTAFFEGDGSQPGFTSLLRSAEEEKRRLDELIAAGQRQIDAAAVASREGDNIWAQAEAALSKGDPDSATAFLQSATDAYVRSLSDAYTDHAAARTTRDADEMNNRISNLQTTIATSNAQKAVTSINKLIVAKQFLDASDALDVAVRAWTAGGQEGTYPPFDNLRQTIQAAVELSQGREISRLDAKADVVNAFLKNAQDNLAAGKLVDASQNVKDALAVAPNYGAAKVLQLLIKKQTDPTGFQRDAAAQIDTYMKMGTQTSSVDDQKTAYLALLDYSKLDPKFAAQTRGTIQELEYSLGLARRPPTPQQIGQSNALVQQANVTQQQGTQEAYQRALDLLRRALQINPDNTDAIRLDGLIRNRMGSTALTALSPTDTQSYNQAYSLFLSGAYQDAYDRVLSIWNDPRSPRNKTYGPLARLKKRLEVQLNIS